MNFAGSSIRLAGGCVFLRIRDHRQRPGIGQCLDGFVSLRELFVGDGVFKRKERIHHFLFRGMPFFQNTVQIFHGAGVRPARILQLLAAHARE